MEKIVFCYTPKGSFTPEAVGQLTAATLEEAEQKMKAAMPQRMKDSGYRCGVIANENLNDNWFLDFSGGKFSEVIEF